MNDFINLLTAFFAIAESKPVITIILVMIIGKGVFLFFVIKEIKKELNRMASSFQGHITDQKVVQKDVVDIRSSVAEINGMLKVILYEKNKS